MNTPSPYDPPPGGAPPYGAPTYATQPYSAQPYEPYGYPGHPYPPYPYPYPAPRTNALAIASLVCAFLFAPLGIVFGHLSLSQIRRSGEDGRGLALAGRVIWPWWPELCSSPGPRGSSGNPATPAGRESRATTPRRPWTPLPWTPLPWHPA